MDTAKQWTEKYPVGTEVRLKGTNIIRKVASPAFHPPARLPLVLLDDGTAVQIDWCERMTPNDQKLSHRRTDVWQTQRFPPN